MLYYLFFLRSEISPLNVFRYITFRAMGAAVTALLIMLLLGPSFIRTLRRLKAGQPIRGKEEVHKLAEIHCSKQGTPTMGGLLILVAVTVSTVLWAIPSNVYIWLALFSLVSLGVLGFFDDWKKIRKQKSGGITSRQKLFWQGIVALCVALFLLYYPGTKVNAGPIPEQPKTTISNVMASKASVGNIYIPFIKDPILTGLGLAIVPFLVLVIVGSSNAVNLTDGLDGLAIGCTISVAIVYGIIAHLTGNHQTAEYLHLPHVEGTGELAVFCAGLIGAGLGFLWFNCHPAKIFMGDTGSLAIGGTLGVISIAVEQEFLLVIVGGVFVMEAVSVILQVASFKLTGKRIFAMSPIHHHFELSGWSETTVVVRFWILSILCAIVGLSTLKLR